ncbi:hypothetical protein BV898_06065 [Hypsibius exemplaris]|uniref:Uncharacterized protein n=1 Tax=Hypsibius exemplaris TaxID=2072580 RepID=A0A1W0WXB5_HYPEX|nr:hypothetical protein BV898_06065 [Hypsibius exemplaris]
MPVTVYPAAVNLTSVTAYNWPEFTSPRDPYTFFKGACRTDVTDNFKWLYQTSFSHDSLNEPYMVSPSSSGFVKAALKAYNHHHRLVIRPEDVWITILTQLSLYVNANAEQLRHVFVAHDGQRELAIRTGGSKYTTDFGKMAEQFSGLIQDNLLDKTLREWILPDFTTTTVTDRIASSIVMMATFKAYFTYKIYLFCGLPAVTLLGERKDWVNLLKKTERLPSFGNQTEQWSSLLRPVLSQFIATFDQPESQAVKDFWNTIAKPVPLASGGRRLSGWITAFAFFSANGESLYDRITEKDERFPDLVLDGVRYHKVDAEDLAPGYAEAKVVLNDNGQIIRTVMVAGVVGIEVLDSGLVGSPVGHTGKRDTLQPVVGWWMYEERGLNGTNLNQQKSENLKGWDDRC